MFYLSKAQCVGKLQDLHERKTGPLSVTPRGDMSSLCFLSFFSRLVASCMFIWYFQTRFRYMSQKAWFVSRSRIHKMYIVGRQAPMWDLTVGNVSSLHFSQCNLRSSKVG